MTDDSFAIRGAMQQASMAMDLAKMQQGKHIAAPVDKPRDLAEAEKAAKDFEALLVSQMMKSMWSTTPADKTLFGSKEEEHYRDMLTQELSKQIANGPGLGIAPIILEELKGRLATESDK